MSEGALTLVLGDIRSEIAAQVPQHEADVAALEAELASAQTEQRRLTKAVAMTDDVSELVSELNKRMARIAHLNAQIMASKRMPEDLAAIVTKIETRARQRIEDMRKKLDDRRDLREVFLALFPRGLTFTAARSSDGGRQLWHSRGEADMANLMEGNPPDCVATPTSTHAVGRRNPPDCVATPTGTLPIGTTIRIRVLVVRPAAVS